MTLIKINMPQLRKKWKVYADNVDAFESILATQGSFFCMDDRVERYTKWLNEFNIFYTLTK